MSTPPPLPPSPGRVYHLPPTGGLLHRSARVLLNFLLPRHCPVCGLRRYAGDAPICPTCLRQIPRYHEGLLRAADRLDGLALPVDAFYSLFLYYPDSPARRVIHRFKYGRFPQIGEYLGRWGAVYSQLSRQQIDFIVPVPIHPAKLTARGFNQSERIARGISQATGIPVLAHALKRVGGTASQTRRNRYARRRALQGVFVPGAERLPAGARVLLVDDLLTTGATLQAASLGLAPQRPASLSVFTLAVDL